MPGTKDPRHALGKLGEQLAADYLRRQGYRIHETNFRCPFGELDIVASEGDVLAFVEVRTRCGDAYGSAQESVTPRKQRKLVQVAEAYLQARYQQTGAGNRDASDQRTSARRSKDRRSTVAPPPLSPRRCGETPACRIDVVAVTMAPNGALERIELIRNAVDA